jgi:four helix bundle protein
MQDFRKLTVWRKAHQLTLDVYRVTRTFPKEELYGLTSQIRRASSSIATNLAEGCGRTGAGELRRFADMAMGSASEVEYLLLLARDLSLMNERDYGEVENRAVEVKRMLASLIVRLRGDSARRSRMADRLTD